MDVTPDNTWNRKVSKSSAGCTSVELVGQSNNCSCVTVRVNVFIIIHIFCSEQIGFQCFFECR